MSGYGTGVENVDAGFAKVSLAWIGGTTDKFSGGNDYIGDLETTDKNNFDLRLKDIETGIGRATFWLNYSNYRLSATELELTRADGWSGGAWIDSDISPDWSNRAAVQYGTGVAANFNSFSPSLRTSIDGEFPEGTRVEDQRRLRILDAMDFRLGERWSMQAVAVYQRDDFGVEGMSDLQWYSLGFRPVYSFNSLYNLALETGYDYTDLETGESGGLFKLTVAGEVTPEVGFFSRPALRFYLTWASWSDEFRGLIGGNTYAEDTSGLAVGAQFESWW
jgi:maltoporin